MSAKYPEDQAEELRRMADPYKADGKLIAVASGKGGVGKSNIAANLAIALRALDFRVILVDADIGLATLDVILKLEVKKPRATLREVLVRDIAVEDALTPAPGGIKLLAGSMGSHMVSDLDEEQRTFLVDCFRKLTALAHFVIIDLGAGISSNVKHFAAAADQLIVVTGPEFPMIVNAYYMIRTVVRKKGHGRFGIVCNLAEDREEGEKVCRKINAISKQFMSDIHVETLGYILRDKNVRLAVKDRQPFILKYPNCPASVCIRGLAEKVLGPVTPGGAEIL